MLAGQVFGEAAAHTFDRGLQCLAARVRPTVYSGIGRPKFRVQR
jgi:hypothetical protein